MELDDIVREASRSWICSSEEATTRYNNSYILVKINIHIHFFSTRFSNIFPLINYIRRARRELMPIILRLRS